MTTDEIFSALNAHMIKAVMTHSQYIEYYSFLNLRGYEKCHCYHYLREMAAHKKLNRYYINHFNKLIPETKIDDPEIIPATWYRYLRQDVDGNTKRNAVKTGLEKWVAWERETKKLYEQMYKELMNLDEVAAAMFVKELICDVDCELKKAERYHLNKIATGYDMVDIIEEQKGKHDKYKCKIEHIGEYYA